MVSRSGSIGGGRVAISRKYEGHLPFNDYYKYSNERIARTVSLTDFNLTVFRLFTFLVKLGIISKRHIDGTII